MLLRSCAAVNTSLPVSTVPAAAAAVTAAAAPPNAANYLWSSLENAETNPSGRAQLHQQLANQLCAPRLAWEAGPRLCGGRGGAVPAGNLHTGGTRKSLSPRARVRVYLGAGGGIEGSWPDWVLPAKERAGGCD